MVMVPAIILATLGCVFSLFMALRCLTIRADMTASYEGPTLFFVCGSIGFALIAGGMVSAL